jgi:methionine-rich copper-binding protein CopC
LAAAALTATVAATIALSLAASPPALAHTALVSSDPTDGEVVASAPTEVALTFDEAIGTPAFVSVVGPDGSDIADGDPVIDDGTVTQAVKILPQQGAYTAAYRVLSADGHPVTGEIHFAVDPAAAATSETAQTPATACVEGCDAASSTSLWQRESTWIVVALVALAVGIAMVFALGLRSRPSNPGSGADG